MEIKHVKFEYEETLNAKKNLLYSELNLLQTAKRVRNYKLLRKKELELKNRLNVYLKSLNAKLNFIQSAFPEKEKSKSFKKEEKVFEGEKQNIFRISLMK